MFTVTLKDETDFVTWRASARALAVAGIEPGLIRWSVAGDVDGDLFQGGDTSLPAMPEGEELSVPRDLVQRLGHVIHHRDPERFAFMYRVLLRVTREKNLLKIVSDPDIQRLERMEKAIRRDAHKMHAFVRFRRIEIGGEEHFVAWFEPDHYIAEREASFFRDRFAGMNWTILTPWRSISWDGKSISIGPGGRKEDAPGEDAAEGLWRTYFSSIFNPARLKTKAMQAEMPKKYWRNLPEAPLIPALIAGADRAAQDMVARMPTLPSPHHRRLQERYWEPKRAQTAMDVNDGEANTIDDLAKQASACTRCPLHQDATQTVFGGGPHDADIVFVGEQPGDREDIAGRPFVGPAGQLFDETLAEVGIDRGRVYVTNAVKHFKFTPRGKRRIHSKPNAGEVQACRWWLDRELDLIKPKLTVALGATALTALSGKALPVTKNRGQIVTSLSGLKVFVTVHPSFLLRIPDKATAASERRAFADDLAAVREMMTAA